MIPSIYPNKVNTILVGNDRQQQKQIMVSCKRIAPQHLKLKEAVHFGDVKECPIKPPPLDEESRANLFYTQKELRRLKKADIEAKRMAEENPDIEFDEDEEVCFRGLEYSLNSKERKENIKSYVQCIVQIYLDQQEMGYVDEYELYAIAKSKSKRDRKLARRMGALDANDAADYIDSEYSENSSLSRNGKRSLKRWVSGQFTKLKRGDSSKWNGLRRCKSQ